MAEPSMFSNLYDVETIQNRNAETSAMNVAQLPAGRATVYGAGLAGSMLAGGVNQMLGRKTPQQQKAEIVNGIMKKYINADPADPQNILMMSRDFADNGLPGLANQFMTQYQTAITASTTKTKPETYQDIEGATRYLTGSTTYEAGALVPGETATTPESVTVPDKIKLFERYQLDGGKDDLKTFLQSLTSKGVTVNTGDQTTLTPGQEAVDKIYATRYVEWNEKQGDMIGQVAQLETVLTKLESGEDLTGVTQGLMPDWFNYLANPDSIAAKERVAEVVQRNLKLILGGQFSEREGEQLIARAYNPALDEKENISRLKRLIMQMNVGIKARVAMNEHWETNGTMKGYKGERVSMQSFYDAMESIQIGGTRGKFTYIGGERSLESSWKLTEAS